MKRTNTSRRWAQVAAELLRASDGITRAMKGASADDRRELARLDTDVMYAHVDTLELSGQGPAARSNAPESARSVR